MSHHASSAAAALALAMIPAAAHAQAPARAEPQAFERVYFDRAFPDGSLRGGTMLLPFADPALLRLDRVPAPCVTIADNGPPSNRVDIVFVGDGYIESELPAYAAHVQAAMADLFSEEPFATYRTYFNVHRVEVVSNESGVDHDPVFGIFRDTELDMGYWCNDIERLLCVGLPRAFGYAANAPDNQQIFAVANSTTYGGAGYTDSDVATFAGANAAATEIAIHEIGHSLGNLADEYDYDGPFTYIGPEFPDPNASILDATAMGVSGTKWAAWLDEPAGLFDGPVSCYEGAHYSLFGAFRPSPESKMRGLERPFNAPSAEALIVTMYQIARPIDSASPTQFSTLSPTASPHVAAQRPVGHALAVQWFLNGAPIPGATSETLDLASVALPTGLSELTARVRDDTPWVRDEALRAAWLTQTAHWFVWNPPCPGDANGDNIVNFADLNIVLFQFGQTGIGLPGDLNHDGIVNFADLNTVLARFGMVLRAHAVRRDASVSLRP